MNILLVIILTLFAVLSRLIPHPPNFTPILAIALYSGFSFKNKFLFIIPLVGMIVSDFFLGYYSSIIWIYFSLLIIFYLGYILSNKYSFKNLIMLSLISSVLFFLISNFAVWLGGWYGYNLSGFIACYVAAIPFFHNTLFSTIIYSSIFHFSYKYSAKIFESKKELI
tara:strand:- start:3225 stop:3725 length:501 start_codon:yes stop_codon:yes gene_type:complete